MNNLTGTAPALPTWEPVTATLLSGGSPDLTYRMRVPGGWIYRTVTVAQHASPNLPDIPAVAMCFVPMPNLAVEAAMDAARSTPSIVREAVWTKTSKKTDPTEGM